MAITSGAGLHQAWLNVGGGSFLLEHGSVEQRSTRKSSTFSGKLPMDLAGAESTFAGLGDNTATITVLTRGMTGTLITGEIDNVHFDYTDRSIHASGRGIGAKLHENMSSEKWVNKKGSEIVQDLAGRAGLGFQGNASSVMAGKLLVQDYVKLSDNISFAYIIQKLAEMDGARWFVDNNGVLNYLTGQNPGGVYTINYAFINGEVISDAKHLRVTTNVQAGKTIKVSAKAWHPYDKQVYKAEVEIGGNGGPLNYSFHIPNLKQDHVQQWAQARAQEIARHKIRVDATVVGDPTCNVNMMLQLNGTAFAGLYEMDVVHHTVGNSGHTTHIMAKVPGSGA